MAGRGATPYARPNSEKAAKAPVPVTPTALATTPASASNPAPPVSEVTTAAANAAAAVKELIIKGPPRAVQRLGNRGKGVVLCLLGLGAVGLVVLAVQTQAKRRSSKASVKEELSFPRELTLRDSPEPESLDNR